MSKVIVIVDLHYGEGLSALPRGVPVWIVDSPTNAPVVKRLWKERPGETHFIGITKFNNCPGNTPETNFIDQLGTIDEHHGPSFHDDPAMEIEAVGTKLTDAIRDALKEFGFDQFRETSDGFEAARSSIPPSP